MRTALLLAVMFLAPQEALHLPGSLLLAPLRAEIVDRIAAIVDGRVITWSEALAEANYQAFQKGQEPLGTLEGEALQKLVSQMIDQELLEKEKDSSPFSSPDKGETKPNLEEIRKRFPNPEAYRKALARYKMTEAELAQHLEQESGIMAFIDYRLRPQVRLAPEMVEAYYRDTLLPELRRGGTTEAPPLAKVRGKIEQILIQQEINHLLEAWIQELHSRAKIRMSIKSSDK